MTKSVRNKKKNDTNVAALSEAYSIIAKSDSNQQRNRTFLQILVFKLMFMFGLNIENNIALLLSIRYKTIFNRSEILMKVQSNKIEP